MSASRIRMVEIQDRKFRGQYLLFCEGCNWKSVELNRTTADLAIRRDAAQHHHER